MTWILAVYFVILLVVLVFAFSYILLQRKTVKMLKTISDEKGDLEKQKKRLNTLSLLNLISFFLLTLLVCWGLVNAIIDYVHIMDNQFLAKRIESGPELENRLYMKPSSGSFFSSPSLWVFLEYPKLGISDYKKLGEGPGELTGKVTMNGKPLTVQKIKLIFNDGALGRDCIKTDARGCYKISLPFGSYFFNAMILEGDAIAGKISPQNELRSKIFFGEKKSLVFKLDELNHSAELPTIETVDPVIHITPNYLVFDMPTTSGGMKIFEWGSFPEALEYRVEITRVEKHLEEGKDSKSFFPDMKNSSFRTRKTFLTFEQFKDLPTVFEPGVYGIRIFAYGKNDRLLSYSSNFHEIAFEDRKSLKVESKK